jgi:hypothetical protein
MEKNAEEEVLQEEVIEQEDEPQSDEGENEQAPEDDAGEAPSEDDGEDERKRRRDAQIERLKKERDEWREKARQVSNEGKKEVSSDLVARTYLAANGITDKEVQQEAIRLAKKFDFSIDAALDDEDIKTRLDNLVKQKTTQRAIAKNTGGASQKQKDVGYYLSYFKQHGDFPTGTSSSMIAKVTQALAE